MKRLRRPPDPTTSPRTWVPKRSKNSAHRDRQAASDETLSAIQLARATLRGPNETLGLTTKSAKGAGDSFVSSNGQRGLPTPPSNESAPELETAADTDAGVAPLEWSWLEAAWGT